MHIIHVDVYKITQYTCTHTRQKLMAHYSWYIIQHTHECTSRKKERKKEKKREREKGKEGGRGSEKGAIPDSPW